MFQSVVGHSSQIHQIRATSKFLKSLKDSPFDGLIEKRKFQKFQLQSKNHWFRFYGHFKDFFVLNLRTKCDLEHFQDIYIPLKV